MAVVTISRQVGSLGDEIAERAAQKLGYELIDRRIIHEQAQARDPAFRKACQAYESEISPHSFFERLLIGDPGFRSLFESLTFELAARGDVVLVGRGAHLVLAGVPGVLKVRIIAPEELRARRIAEKKGVSLEEARRFVETYGRRRKALLESIYHQDIADPLLFDLVINTAELAVEEAVGLIAEAAGSLGRRADREARRKILERMAFAKEIERAVKKALTSLAYRHVSVMVDEQGVVTLTGVVADESQKAKAEKAALGVAGVEKVANKLTVTPLYF